MITYLALINLIASYAFSTGTMGNIGPNISSSIILSRGVTSVMIVGDTKRSWGSLLPPTAILSLLASSRACSRLKLLYSKLKKTLNTQNTQNMNCNKALIGKLIFNKHYIDIWFRQFWFELRKRFLFVEKVISPTATKMSLAHYLNHFN